MRARWRRLRSLSKRTAQIIVSTCVTVLILEVILRLGGFLWFSYNPFYLYYGLHDLLGSGGILRSAGKTGTYFKFPPNYLLRGLRGQASETASINSLGFRGADFEPAKPNGLFRVICMGESSTFGFSNTDDATYPFLLGKIFQQGYTTRKVEVINAGFPYYNTANILALLEEELLAYKPDVLTLYAGANDSGWPLEVGILGRTIFWLQQRSMIFFALDAFAYKVQTTKLFRRITGKVAKLIPQNIDSAAFDRDINLVALRYRNNVKAMIALAKKNNTPIVLIKQPMTTDHRKYVSLSYEGEYRLLLDELQLHPSLSIKEMMLLRHHRLMEELESIAREENVPLVDNIVIVDQDRRRLVSWVHLTTEANLRLAEALKAVIEPYVISKRAA